MTCVIKSPHKKPETNMQVLHQRYIDRFFSPKSVTEERFPRLTVWDQRDGKLWNNLEVKCYLQKKKKRQKKIKMLLSCSPLSHKKLCLNLFKVYTVNYWLFVEGACYLQEELPKAWGMILQNLIVWKECGPFIMGNNLGGILVYCRKWLFPAGKGKRYCC